MPPSLYLRTLPTILSVKNGQHFILAPLTLALSPGRGNRVVDADSMQQLYDSLKRLRGHFEHNNQPYFQTPRFSKP